MGRPKGAKNKKGVRFDYTNKDLLNAWHKSYYQKNRKKILDLKREKYQLKFGEI